MKRLLPMILICILLASCLVFPASAKEGTEGDELQVLQPEQLEIQLGAELAGAQFSLKTDAGMYPGTVVADANGTLKLEIGGSSSYVLTRLDAASAAPAAVLTDDPTQPVSEMPAGEAETAAPEETVPAEPAQQDNTIPTMHIVLFAGGTALCIAFLVISFVLKRRRARDYYEEDEEV